MTINLYDNNPYMKEFKATVLEVSEAKKGYLIVLDKTAFFPEQGGQYSDKGYIGEAKITDCQIKDGVIYHLSDTKLNVGEEYICKIDFEERYTKMQNHSGEHIVSGLINTLYGYNNVGFHLSDDGVTIDYDGYLDREQLDDIEKRANEAIYKNIEIVCEYPSEEKLKTINYRSKLDLLENVRIVTIPGYDVCACCAPHVNRTGEIGIIKLLDAIHYKGGIRIKMLAGRLALEDYSSKFKVLSSIGNLLSTKQEDAYSIVEGLSNENKKLKYEANEAKKIISKVYADNLKNTDNNICVILPGLDIPSIREFVNMAINKTSKMCAGFSSDGKGGYNYVIGSNTVNMSEEVKKINANLNGHGGGKPSMVQGSVNAKEEDIIKYFM